MINTLSKINLSKIGWEGGGVNLNLDNVFKYTVVFFDATPYSLFYDQAKKTQQWSSSFHMKLRNLLIFMFQDILGGSGFSIHALIQVACE